jgi:hypothetical protein
MAVPQPPTLRRVEKPEFDFAVKVPVDWCEEPPDLHNSPWEAARFVGAGSRGGSRRCLVFRHPKRPNADAYVLAQSVQPILEQSGFGNFRFIDAVVAGGPATRLDFDRASLAGIWAVRQYFIAVDDVPFCVSFGTAAPDEDGALFDALVAEFQLLGDLANARAISNTHAGRAACTVTKPEYGLTLNLPPGWEERPPNPKVSPWEVARFVEPGDRRHAGIVSRQPRPGTGVRQVAEEHQESLRLSGYAGLKLAEAIVAGQEGIRLDAAMTDAGRVWALRVYNLVIDGMSFSLSLGSAVPEEDANLLDAIAAGFRLLPAA